MGLKSKSWKLHTTLVACLGIATLTGGCDKEDSTPTVIDAGLLEDRCLDPGDMNIVLAYYVDAGWDGEVPNPGSEAYDCTLTPTCASLYFDERYDEAYACVNDCLDGKPSAPLSLECRDCFVLEAVTCAGSYCFSACVGGDEVACSECYNANCTERVETCVGFPLQP